MHTVLDGSRNAHSVLDGSRNAHSVLDGSRNAHSDFWVSVATCIGCDLWSEGPGFVRVRVFELDTSGA